MSITLKDMAKELGLSPSTVSRALNNNPTISPETKEKVKDLAKMKNYKRNQVAMGLRIHKTYCLGLVVPNISSHFFSSIIGGVQEIASKHNYQVLICQTNDRQDKEEDILNTITGRVDGVLLSLAQDTKSFHHVELAMHEKPFVLFDRVSQEIETIHVEAEDYMGALRATSHLISEGAKNIAFLSGPRILNVCINRENGYIGALRQNNIRIKKSLIKNCDFGIGNMRNVIDDLLKTDPGIDAIFAVNDDFAVEAMLYLQDLGYSIPRDIKIVGFGDYPICELVRPKLTSVCHKPQRIGEVAAINLIQLINGDIEASGNREIIGSELIIRESSKN